MMLTIIPDETPVAKGRMEFLHHYCAKLSSLPCKLRCKLVLQVAREEGNTDTGRRSRRISERALDAPG
ncbi:hypothetical protein AVEN_109552-1 [Araneus ventricosus]|uniref:Uncharacterized protein n=1 Tax=Araneus ventricosus TaxID=182803 RepID=A0A4Y2R0I2_ARAVE|nr:hypothetical protein AVEN_109552-1 [Araneus ventricosus]